jgi:hypothetical protein
MFVESYRGGAKYPKKMGKMESRGGVWRINLDLDVGLRFRV